MHVVCRDIPSKCGILEGLELTQGQVLFLLVYDQQSYFPKLQAGKPVQTVHNTDVYLGNRMMQGPLSRLLLD